MQPTGVVQLFAAAAAAPAQQVDRCFGDAAAAALLLRPKQQLGEAGGGVGCRWQGGGECKLNHKAACSRWSAQNSS